MKLSSIAARGGSLAPPYIPQAVGITVQHLGNPKSPQP